MRPKFKIRSVASVALALLAATSATDLARATNYTWGGSFSYWDAPNVWSPNGTPGANDNASILSSTSFIQNAQNVAKLTLNGGSLSIGGNGTYGDAALNATSVNIIAGALSLTTYDANYTDSLYTTAGITVGASGTFALNVGNGGGRYISGAVINSGQIEINQPAAFYANGASSEFRNNAGQVNLRAETTLIGMTLNQMAGTIAMTGSGSLEIGGGAFNFSGGRVAGTVNLAGNASLSTTVANGNNTQIYARSTYTPLTSNLAPGTLLFVNGNANVGDVTLHVNSGAYNYGQIYFSTENANYTDYLTVENDATFYNAGIIGFNGGAGGARYVQGQINNRPGASIYCNQGTDFTGSIDNYGAINFYQTNSIHNAIFSLESGSSTYVSPSGYLLLDNSIFVWKQGATFNGNAEFRESCDVSLQVADGNNSTFTFSRNAGRIISNIPPHTTIYTGGNASVGDQELTFPQSTTNYGTINVRSENANYTSYLTVAGTLTNAGTINLLQGTGGARVLNGTYVNNYAIYDNGDETDIYGHVINQNLYQRGNTGNTVLRDGAVFDQNFGQLLVQGGFYNYGSTLNLNGGSVSGTFYLNYGAHLSTYVTGNNVHFYNYGNAYLDSTLTNGNTFRQIANASIGDSHLEIRDGRANYGTIKLDAQDANYTSGIWIYRPSQSDYHGTLSNFGYLMPANDNAVGGGREIYGNVVNFGHLDLYTNFVVHGDVSNNVGGEVSINNDCTFGVDGTYGNGTPFDARFIMNGGTLTIQKGGQLQFYGGADYAFYGGKLYLAGKLQVPSHSPLLAADVISVGPEGSFSITSGGLAVGGQLIGQDGNGLIGQDGNGIVAQGAGNVISNDGGTIIAEGGNGFVGHNGSALKTTRSSGFGPSEAGGDIGANGPGSSVQMLGGNIDAAGNGTFTNGGLLTGAGYFTATAFDIDAASSVTATGGTLHLLGTFNPIVGSTLTTGHYRIDPNSSLDIPSAAPILTNQAAITLSGAASTWTNINSLAANAGTFTLAGDRTFTTAGNLANSGQLVLADPASRLNVAGSLTGAGPITNNGTLDLAPAPNTSATLASPISGTGNLSQSAPGTTTLTGALSYTGNTTVSAGKLLLTSPLRPLTGALTVAPQAQVILAASPSPTQHTVAAELGALSIAGLVQIPATDRTAAQHLVAVAASLSITAAGTLDLTNNDLLIHAGPTSESTLRALVATWYNNGARNGPGLASSTATPFTTLAVTTNADHGFPLFSTFDGQPASPTDLLVKYTYVGDTNLDGILNGADLANLIESLSTGAPGGAAWQSGDLNYDNVVNATDLNLFSAAYTAFQANPISLGSPADTGTGNQGTVPEPATVLLAFPAILSITRRRRP